MNFMIESSSDVLRRRRRSAVWVLGVVGLLAAPGWLWAGDPIPDVDVILEQVPGGVMTLEVRPPLGYDGDPIPDVDVILEQVLGFDAVRLSGDKALKSLSLVDLPTGWGLRPDGKRLILSGPRIAPPVRFRLETGGARPEQLSVELLAGKEVRFSRTKINPRIVPRRVVAGTIQGTVRLPPRVSPGETIALRSLADAKLPPGGRWVISGTVSEPWDEDELRLLRTTVNTTRSHLEGKLAQPLAAASEPLLLHGEGGCPGLAPVAAVWWACGDSVRGETTLQVLELKSGEPAGTGAGVLLADLSPSMLETALRARHDPAMSAIRNMKFFFTIEGEGAAISIKEEGVEEPQGKQPSRQNAPGRRPIGAREAWRVELEVGGPTLSWTWTAVPKLPVAPPGPDGSAAGGKTSTTAVAFYGEPVAGGCRFKPRALDDLDLARWARMQAAKPDRSGGPTGKPPNPELHFVTLPIDLAPGDTISVRYLDAWGDAWVDVGEVPGVEVVPPAAEPQGATLENASAYVLAGDQVCVCGTFSALDAVAELSLGGRPAAVVASSGRVVWLQTPADLVGPAVIRGQGMRGEATTDLLRIGAELDQEHLFSGQSTPLRILVEGSTAVLPIHLTNGSPQVIELEGGADQWTETSGGTVNQVLRQVRGLERGAFELGWELRSATCPCAEPDRAPQTVARGPS